MKHRMIRLAAAAFVAIVLCLAGSFASAQSPKDLSAFMGTWKINAAKTKMGRNGPTGQNILRSTTFTFKFVPDGKGVRMDVYAHYPQPEPTRVSKVVTDGTVLPCESKPSCLTVGGDPKDQTFAWYKIDDHMLARLFWIKGKPYDYSSMCISTDGKTLTLISWDPATPQYQNIQVFDRQP